MLLKEILGKASSSFDKFLSDAALHREKQETRRMVVLEMDGSIQIGLSQTCSNGKNVLS